MDNNRPKRVRHKDNPYKIFTEQGKYYVSFKDGQGNAIVQEVTKEIFDLFDNIELKDKSEMNEYSRHIEYSQQTEINLYQKTLSKTSSFEGMK